MKWTTILGLVSTLVVATCLAQSLDAANQSAGSDSNYSIRVTAPAGRIRLSSPIDITVVVTNVSDRILGWRAEYGNTEYKALRVLLTRDRREAETTFLHRKITGRVRSDDPPEVNGGSEVLFELAPGKAITYTLNLQRLYKISEPGEYTLEVSCGRACYEDPGKAVRAKSLTLKIER